MERDGPEERIADAVAAALRASSGATFDPHRARCAQRARRRERIGETAAKVALLFGICVGGAAAVTSVVPATAGWTSPIVCRGGADLAYTASRVTDKSGRSSTSVAFQCLDEAGGYDANILAIGVLQSLLVAFVLGTALFAWRMIERRRAGDG